MPTLDSMNKPLLALRVAGESRGADLDVERARQCDLPVYCDVSELPRREPLPGGVSS
jgi:hypothetical protein